MTLPLPRRVLALTAACLLLSSGCGSHHERPKTHVVRGRILLAGEPVNAAEVSFVPKMARPEGRPARGRTDEAGEFTLRTYFTPAEELVGAVADDYTVVVTKTELPATVEEGLRKPASNLLPSRYASAQTSGLSATVEAGGENSFSFELSTR